MATTTEALKTASIYVRVSRAAGDTNLSVEGMTDDCRALAERHGLSVVAVHIDDGLSGAIRNRPAFLAWLADAEEGRAGTLVAWSADRLTREGANATARVLDAIEGKDASGAVVRPGVRLLTEDGLDSAGDSDAFRLNFLIKAEMARAELAKITARNQARSDRLKAAGRFVGGTAPFGTKAVPAEDGRGKVLALVEEEAAVLRKAAQLLINGETMRAVAVWMNEHGGIPPRRAEHWTPTSVKMVLKTACKYGLVFSPVQAAALKPFVTFDPDRKAPKAQRSLLSRGLLLCSGCGRAMLPSGTIKRPMYACPSFGDTTPCARRVSVSGRLADEIVADDFLERFGRFSLYAEEVEIRSVADVDAAQAAYDDAQAALSAALTEEALQAAKAAREALEEAKATRPTAEVVMRDTGQTIAEAWEGADPETRARYLRIALAGPITLKPPTARGYASPEKMRERVAARLEYGWRGVYTPEAEYADLMREIARDD